jgi:EmrB/QacA subfamily drug resistance transporter
MRLRNIPYKWIVAVAFVAGLSMDLMDSTIVNVALPRLGQQFHTDNSTLEWVVTGYLLSLAVWIPASGWIGDRFGTKRTFMFALAMFTACSVLCGFAQNMGQLIGFRILQGVGGGMLTPVGAAMLFRAFPPAERARASTILMLPTITAPALGPVLGGWLVTDVTWRAIFFVNLPIGLSGFLFSLFFLREHREESAGRFDLLGFLFSGCGLALVLYALSRGPEDGWTAANVLIAGLGGLVLFALLTVVELRRREPMLDLRLFANRLFRNANLTFYMGAGSLFSGILILTLLLQELRGLTALEAGLVSLPMSLGMIAIIPLVGRLYPVVGPRRLIAVGMLGAAATSLLFIGVDLRTNLLWVDGIMFLRGMAFGLCIIPVQAASYATIQPKDMGRATSLFSTGRQVATSLSIALLITVLTSRARTHISAAVQVAGPAARASAIQHGTLLAFHDAFAVSALIALVGIGFALLIRDSDAAATMRTRPSTPVEAEPVPLLAEASGAAAAD